MSEEDGRRGDALYLNDVLLGPLAVYAGAQCVSCKMAGQIVGFAGRYIRYTHVLRAESNEIVDGRIVEALDIRAKELAPWQCCPPSSATGHLFCFRCNTNLGKTRLHRSHLTVRVYLSVDKLRVPPVHRRSQTSS